ncbi:hypothetical protein Trydic_g7584 [Trypoxylus dichotomus]
MDAVKAVGIVAGWEWSHLTGVALKFHFLPRPVATMHWNSQERAFAVEVYFTNGFSMITTQHIFQNRYNLAPLTPVADQKSIIAWVNTFRQTAEYRKTKEWRPSTCQIT